jgi:hypothetical protein
VEDNDVMSDEAERIARNIIAVRAYLAEEFQGFELRDKSEAPFDHIFTVRYEYQVYKLKVAIPRLSDMQYTPESLHSLLRRHKVAEEMRKSGDGGFLWGR